MTRCPQYSALDVKGENVKSFSGHESYRLQRSSDTLMEKRWIFRENEMHRYVQPLERF